MQVKELHTLEEMLPYLNVIRELYPEITEEYYEELLEKMIPHNYHQLAVFKDDECIAISGYWIGRKLWCGLYLELDNVVVKESARGTGAGKLMEHYLNEKAAKLGANIMVLDAYSNNFKAHRFYYNQGYAPRGFHFIKILNKDGLT
jgi:GNAT superfamily N-acetyltransferase